VQDSTLNGSVPPVGERGRGSRPIVWGLVLIVAGLLFMFGNMGYFRDTGGLVWSTFFAVGGAVFLYRFARSPQLTWWAAIPGCTLLGLAGTIFFAEVAPVVFSSLAPGAILGGIGLGFLLVYWARREFWWALIPGGVMFSTAATAVVAESGRFDDATAGGVTLLGIGLTFLVVALTSGEGRSRRWAYIPATVMLVLGLMVSASATRALMLVGWMWPAALIVTGGWILYVALSRRDGNG